MQQKQTWFLKMVRPVVIVKTNKEDDALVEQFLEMIVAERAVAADTVAATSAIYMGFQDIAMILVSI